MKRIFQDNELNDNFEKRGYVSVDLLNKEQFAHLKILAQKLLKSNEGVKKNVDSDYDLSFFSQSVDVKQTIFNQLWDFFAEPVAKYLPDYEPLIINMFDKKPGTGEIPIHQNWTFVDEDQYTSVSVWIPLCGVSRTNGTLEVVPGTHQHVSKYRSPSIPWVFSGLENPLKEKFMQPLNLRAGQVGIIDDSVIHYSSDNHSSEHRPTIQLILKPKQAKALHYLGGVEDPHQIQVYEVDSKFFMGFNMHSREINGQLIEEKHIDNPPLTLERLEKIFEEASQ